MILVHSVANLSLLIREDFGLFLDFPSDRCILSTFVGGHKGAAVAEEREEKPEILTNRQGRG